MKLTPLLLLVTFGLGIYLGFGSESDQIRHQSFFSTKEFFDEAYSAADATPSKEGAKMILVNHHLLAKDLIAEAFNTVSNPPKTVVLISPNHFGVGQFHALTSEVNWDTPYGVLRVNQGVIHLLEKSGSVQVDPIPFNYEHGVSGIVPFIKHSFPRANVVPIIIKEKMKPDEAEKLLSVLSEVIPDNSLIVWSV